MKKNVFFLLAFFSAFLLRAQTDYKKVDSLAHAFQESYTDAADLGRKLTRPLAAEREKARAIFTWLALNIRYDYAQSQNPPGVRLYGRTQAEIDQQELAWKEKEAENALRQKRGICGDYSHLFKLMARAAGLETMVVSGKSRMLSGSGAGHAWNAVKIDGQWRLIDATWGAGYVEEGRFVREFLPGFFDTPPALFILNHLPDDASWQLLGQPVSAKAFSRQVLLNYGRADFTVEAYEPAHGLLRKPDGVAEIRLKFGDPPPVIVVADNKSRVLAVRVHTTDDGWTVLRFSPGSASEITVFAGENREGTPWLGRFFVM